MREKNLIIGVAKKMFNIGPYEIKNPFVLAPMAGVSQMPFRRLALKMGASLAPTELVSAKGLFFESLRTKSYLTYDREVEKPFCVQLFGGEEEPMAVAAEIAMSMGAQIIDINMGCPVKKVTKINAGSALLCDYARAARIVSAMLKRLNYKIPITAKIRSGWDQNNQNFLEVARALEEAGTAAIAIHPRTRAQGYSGKANWAHIGILKSHLKIPVIGNGDVLDIDLANKMRKMTNCDAVMIGRAALGNPWIFRDLMAQKSRVVSAVERLTIVENHLNDHIEFSKIIADNENKCGRRPFDEMQALRSFRSHLIWYSKGLTDGARFRQNIMTSSCITQTKDLIHQFFSESCASSIPVPEEEGIDYRQAFG